MSLQDDLDSIKASEVEIDSDITILADGIDQIHSTVQGLISQIPTAATTGEATALATAASAEVSKLGTIVTALKAINSSNNPPVVEPPVENPPTTAPFDPGTTTEDPFAEQKARILGS